jgi:hypothetical protein
LKTTITISSIYNILPLTFFLHQPPHPNSL